MNLDNENKQEYELIISVSGIRGIVDHSLTDTIVKNFCFAYATYLPNNARIILARDTRPSGIQFMEVAKRTLIEMGCHVFDLGCIPTPTAKLMVNKLDAQGGIIITASHNPSEWNGLKLIRSDGVYLNAKQSAKVEQIYHRRNFVKKRGGSEEKIDISFSKQQHLKQILPIIDVETIRAAKLSIVVDPCNGTGGIIAKDLLKELGVKAQFINAEPNGNFAHDPEPIPSNLKSLGEAVRNSSSLLGCAIDPDGDRVTLVNSSGYPVGEDKTLALAICATTKNQQGCVVTTLSTSQSVIDVAKANGCTIRLTPVGEVHVIEKMFKTNALIGGEGNGGVILHEVIPGRDAAIGIALVLEIIAKSRLTLEEILKKIPAYFIEKRKIISNTNQLDYTVSKLLQNYSKAQVHPVNDGSKIYINGDYKCPWVHLRSSNTEPVVRIIAEAESDKITKSLCDEVEEIVDQTA